MSGLTNRRFGKFSIPTSVIEDAPDVARAALKDCIILQADTCFAILGIEYVAQCDDFDFVALGEQIPRYDAVFGKKKSGKIFRKKWRRM